MTRKTVETHLGHVYRKLGISGRAELSHVGGRAAGRWLTGSPSASRSAPQVAPQGRPGRVPAAHAVDAAAGGRRR